MKAKIKLFINVGVILFLAVFLSGCISQMMSPKSEDAQTATEQAKTRQTTAMYYDFEDVLIPMELSVVKDRTVVVATPGFTSGIITLKGRVERSSLFNFFNNNMQKDNWTVLSQIKSPGTTIMVFQKANRICVIGIRDEQIYTYVEVGVAPTLVADGGFKETPLTQ
ncbi:MAG: hypothetical protein ABIJ31_00355 [Pseudomonadota bacterium]